MSRSLTKPAIIAALVGLYSAFFLGLLVLLFVPGSHRLTKPLTCPGGELLDRRATFSMPGRTTVNLHYACAETEGGERYVTARVMTVMTGYVLALVAAVIVVLLRRMRSRLLAVPRSSSRARLGAPSPTAGAALLLLTSAVAFPLTALTQTDSLRRGPSAPLRDTRPCTLVRVVDGDTIECRGVGRVRLIGIDTPERSQAPYSVQATRTLIALLADSQNIRLERDVEERDRYGRVLAYVWKGDVLVNWAMVRQGFAVVLTYPPNVQYVARFTAAQRVAREEGLGLWGINGFDCLPRERRRRNC